MVTTTVEIIVGLCVSAVVYNYIGYPVLLFGLCTLSQAKSDLLFVLAKRGRRKPRIERDLPSVAVLLSAYNEQDVIRQKIANCLELDYPHHRIEFLVGLDAPSDSTAEMLAEVAASRVRVWHFTERRGKLRVLTALANETAADIVVTTDANTMLEPSCIRALVRHFANPRVGAVSGEEKRIALNGSDSGGESLYWRYESALKFLENRLNCSVGGNGSVLAVRRSLFRLEKPSIVEDFQIPLDIRFKGYRVVYDPEALAIEEITPSRSAQFARRIRLGAGDFQTLFANLRCLDPRKGLPAFCFFSHRVLRWLGPVFLLVILAGSCVLIAQPIFQMLLLAQILFYVAALTGHIRKTQLQPAGVFGLPLQFAAMNLALLLGLIQFLSGRQSAIWKSTPRVSGPAATRETA